VLLEALRSAWDLVAGNKTEVLEAWAEDELVFEEHFGVPYEEFDEKLHMLDRGQFELYEKTLKINPEAAVTWVFFLMTME
jgi:hypothetical protein